MTTFDYTTFDLQNPDGNNGLSSFALYFQRIMYKEAVYPTNVKTPLDTWYDKMYFGRVDQLQNTVIPVYDNLITFKTVGRQNLFALNFVVDAFEEFAAHMRNATILGVLKTQAQNTNQSVQGPNDKIYDIKAYQAYNDPTRIYSQYTQQLYNSFVSGLTEKERNEITNFQTFLNLWSAYLINVSSFIPVTKTNYLLTPVNNFFSSGLSVAVDLGPPEVDSYKYENWINDPNFDFYIRAAKKFGFIVNKNMPWILTADLFSDAIKKYFSRYYIQSLNSIITEDNFFDAYYEQTYLTDISNIKQLTINAYTAFIQNNPLYQEKTYIPNCDKYSVVNRTRKPLPANVDIFITDKVLIDLYLSIRSKEAREPVQITSKLKQELSNIYSIRPDKSLDGLGNAANYINLIYRDYIYDFTTLLLNPDILNDLDNQVRTGKIATVGSIAQQLY